MESIVLNKIEKENNKVCYKFSVSTGLQKYFSDSPFEIYYPDSIEDIPDAVLAVPFVCNVLPIIWLTDSLLYITELDKMFFKSIPEFKKGYMTMFPEAEFLGNVKVDREVECSSNSEERSALFYSGGLDSSQTLISHLDENPILLSIWGSDIRYNNEDGWNLVHKVISNTAKKFNLSEYVFHSSFRDFDKESVLQNDFYAKLKDGWWHGVKHGIALLGHVAPFAYKHNITKMYIASSFCSEDGLIKCASSPLIDNFIKFCGCSVFHDGVEYSRQDKTHNLAEFYNETGIKIDLHVCWESQQGDNCCHCEKCYRTMASLWAENQDPRNFGFNFSQQNLLKMKSYILNMSNVLSVQHWNYIKIKAIANKKVLKTSPLYIYFKWIYSIDFNIEDGIKLPLLLKFKITHQADSFREFMSTFKFYQKLHDIKIKNKHRIIIWRK